MPKWFGGTMLLDHHPAGRHGFSLPGLHIGLSRGLVHPGWVRALVLAAAVGFAYFLAARLSLAFLTKPDGVAVFWPAAGVAAGLLIGARWSDRLPIVAGVIGATLVANLLGDRNIWGSVVFALCNAGEALLVAALITLFFGSQFGMNRPHHVLGFIVVAIVSTAISGIGATAGYVLFHTTAPPMTIWQHWFASDTIGIIAVAPFLIELSSTHSRRPPRGELFEGLIALIFVTALSIAAVQLPNEAWAVEITIAALFPMFLWIGARCQPGFTAAGVLIFALTIVWAATFEIGVFGADIPVSERIHIAQFVILVQVLFALMLAALFAERRHHIATLQDSQAKLRVALKAARDADQAKTSFLAAASHDLRQPLQTVGLLHAALKPQLNDERQLILLMQMERAVDVMNGMLVTLLDINRLEAGILRPTISDFPISAVLDSLAEDFAIPAEEKGLVWRSVRSEMWLRTDRQMLEEMLRNLISNAIRYTDEGRILVGCRRVGDKALIQVWDSGVGIASKDVPRIFDEYYQVPKAEPLGGFGLGLAIVQRMAKILGHRIDVKSEPGKGSGFSIEVPLGRSQIVPTEADRPTAAAGDDLSGTVLLIEDEGAVRVAFGSLLRSYGLDVVSVATADQALRCVSEGTVPDIIVSDYNLPGNITGIQAIESLNKILARETPAIIVTGDTRKEILDMIDLTRVGVVVKPARADDILKLVRGSLHA